MKKILIFCAIILFGSTLVFAQDVRVRQGESVKSRSSNKKDKVVVKSQKTIKTKKEKNIKKRGGALNSSEGDDAQLADIDLQNNLDKQRKTVETISNEPKTMHDTAENVIRNMK